MSDEENEAEMIYYTVRFPIEWEERIESLQQQIERNKPAELLKVSAAAVIRRAFRIGVERLSDTYNEAEGGKDVG